MGAFWRWTLLLVGALLALVLLVAGALAYLVSRIDVRAEVERIVENATGRDLTITGDVGVSYWPVLGLHAENAALANVEGGRASSFMAADDIRIGVEIRPLFDRQVVVRRLVLQHPRIALEVDAEGAPNWVLAPPPGRPGAAAATTPPAEPVIDMAQMSLREVRIEHGEASFYDARRGVGWVVGDVSLRTALTSLDEPMRAAGRLIYNERTVRLSLEVEKPGAAIRGRATALKVNAESELLTANFEGETTAASGEVAGAVHAAGPNLRQLAAWNGAPLQPGVGLGPFSVSGRIAIAAGQYEFSNAAFTLDRIAGRGDFTLSQRRGKPYVSGRLELWDFDLNPYLTGQAPAPAESPAAPALTQTAAAPTAEIAAVEAPPRALDVRAGPSEAPIDFSGLHLFNADLELSTHAVLVQHMRIDSGRLNLVLNDGYLAATLHNLSLYGGSGRGRFEVDAREGAPRILQDFAFDGLDARGFLSDAFNLSNIEGRAELSIYLRTRGTTPTELIGASYGRTHIEVISGVLHGVDLGGVATTIRNALRGELIAPEAATPFHGFSATFAIAEGVLASDDLSFNTPDLRIPGVGLIDVPGQRLDLRLSPRSPRGGLTAPFSIRGAWGAFAYNHDLGARTLRELQPRVAAVEAAARAGPN